MERRKLPRSSAQIAARYWLPGQISDFRSTWTRDISEAGIHLWMSENVSVGQEIRCVLRAKSDEAWWPETNGTVVWQGDIVDRPNGSGQARPTGISLRNVSPSVRNRIGALVGDGKAAEGHKEGIPSGGKETEQICARCILPASVPNINFDPEGVCSFCRDYERREAPHPKDYRALDQALRKILKTDPRKHPYDCLCLYSGGKDSTYMLHLLVNKYKLRVLAFTFDNWFLPLETYTNIKKVLSKVGADHILFRPSWEVNKDIFQTGMLQAHRTDATRELAYMIGHACWPCFAQIALHATRLCVDKNIPSMVVGTTPGQIRQKKYDLVSKFGDLLDVYKAMIQPMLRLLDLTQKRERREALDLPFHKKLQVMRMRLVPFYEYVRYDEQVVIETVAQEFDFQKPESTDSCSTNCQLNSLGIEVHRRRYGLSPYVIPLARDVREGLVKRDDALKAVQGKLNSKLVQSIAGKLGVDV